MSGQVDFDSLQRVCYDLGFEQVSVLGHGGLFLVGFDHDTTQLRVVFHFFFKVSLFFCNLFDI